MRHRSRRAGAASRVRRRRVALRRDRQARRREGRRLATQLADAAAEPQERPYAQPPRTPARPGGGWGPRCGVCGGGSGALARGFGGDEAQRRVRPEVAPRGDVAVCGGVERQHQLRQPPHRTQRSPHVPHAPAPTAAERGSWPHSRQQEASTSSVVVVVSPGRCGVGRRSWGRGDDSAVAEDGAPVGESAEGVVWRWKAEAATPGRATFLQRGGTCEFEKRQIIKKKVIRMERPQTYLAGQYSQGLEHRTLSRRCVVGS